MRRRQQQQPQQPQQQRRRRYHPFVASSSSTTRTRTRSARTVAAGVVVVAILIAAIAAVAGAFDSRVPRMFRELGIRSTTRRSPPSPRGGVVVVGRSGAAATTTTTVALAGSWLEDAFRSLGLDLTAEKSRIIPRSSANDDDDDGNRRSSATAGTVVRTASKAYASDGSSDPRGGTGGAAAAAAAYTTRKESRGAGGISVRPEGVEGDYNHYRTVALDSTPDRAVSILTTDVLRVLRGAGWTAVSEGDLGENLTVDGVDFSFFEVGGRYAFRSHGDGDESDAVVVVEITERIEPCGNLCKLPYIDDRNLPPKDRFEGCKRFLLHLDAKDGLRGWYGKVLGTGGSVRVGDRVSRLLTGTA